jgi:hypothetical protein
MHNPVIQSQSMERLFTIYILLRSKIFIPVLIIHSSIIKPRSSSARRGKLVDKMNNMQTKAAPTNSLAWMGVPGTLQLCSSRQWSGERERSEYLCTVEAKI